jgi:hypothetical protein
MEQGCVPPFVGSSQPEIKSSWGFTITGGKFGMVDFDQGGRSPDHDKPAKTDLRIRLGLYCLATRVYRAPALQFVPAEYLRFCLDHEQRH